MTQLAVNLDKKPTPSQRFKWEKEKARYLDRRTNKAVTDKQLYAAVAKRQRQYKKKMEKLVNTSVNGKKVDLDKLQPRMAKLVKNMHVDMLRLGRGGKENTHANHYLNLGNHLKNVEYPAIRRLMLKLERGEISKKQFSQRMVNYVGTSRSSFERGRASLYADNLPPTEVQAKRILGKCANHCADCLAYAQLGYVPLSQLILPTQQCQCMMNCCCSVVIKKRIA